MMPRKTKTSRKRTSAKEGLKALSVEEAVHAGAAAIVARPGKPADPPPPVEEPDFGLDGDYRSYSEIQHDPETFAPEGWKKDPSKHYYWGLNETRKMALYRSKGYTVTQGPKGPIYRGQNVLIEMPLELREAHRLRQQRLNKERETGAAMREFDRQANRYTQTGKFSTFDDGPVRQIR